MDFLQSVGLLEFMSPGICNVSGIDILCTVGAINIMGVWLTSAKFYGNLVCLQCICMLV